MDIKRTTTKVTLNVIYGFDGLTGTGGVDSDRDRQLISSVSCRW